MKNPMTTAVATRIPKPLRREFIRKARKENGMGQSDILRALIRAYVEGSITIQPATQPIATE